MKITRRVIFVIILKIEIVIYPYFLGLFEIYIVDVHFHENGSQHFKTKIDKNTLIFIIFFK